MAEGFSDNTTNITRGPWFRKVKVWSHTNRQNKTNTYLYIYIDVGAPHYCATSDDQLMKKKN